LVLSETVPELPGRLRDALEAAATGVIHLDFAEKLYLFYTSHSHDDANVKTATAENLTTGKEEDTTTSANRRANFPIFQAEEMNQ
jgi:hypothetical protein